jgi:hypothetical protein
MPELTEEQTADRSWICRSIIGQQYGLNASGCQTHVSIRCNQPATYILNNQYDYISEYAGIDDSERLTSIGVDWRPRGTPVCSSHYIESCDVCGDEGMVVESTESLNQAVGPICENCAEEYQRCGDCGDWFHQDDLGYNEDAGDSYCSSCAPDHYVSEEEEEYNHPAICNHSHKPFWVFRLDPQKDKMIARWPMPSWDWSGNIFRKETMYNFSQYVIKATSLDEKEEVYERWYSRIMKTGTHTSCGLFIERSLNIFCGLELEVETPNENSYERTLDYLEKNYGGQSDNQILFMKHDGSLSNIGYEICFHPFTLNGFKKFVPAEMFEYLRLNGVRSWDTDNCGIHIHVSKTSLYNQSHQYRFAQFINNNSKNNFAVAGRDTHWAKYPSQERPESLKIMKAIKGDASRDYDRYVAVNLTPKETIEVRIFRGSLKYKRILATIEYVTAVAEYTKDISIRQIWEGGAWDWRPFREFVAKNAATYGNLAGYLKIKNQLQKEREVVH